MVYSEPLYKGTKSQIHKRLIKEHVIKTNENDAVEVT